MCVSFIDPHVVLYMEVMKMLFLTNEDGQGLVEYALILVLVAIVAIAILIASGGDGL